MLKRNIAVHILTLITAAPVLGYINTDWWYVFSQALWFVGGDGRFPFGQMIIHLVGYVSILWGITAVSTFTLSCNQPTILLRIYGWAHMAYLSVVAIISVYSFFSRISSSYPISTILVEFSPLILLVILFWGDRQLRRYPKVKRAGLSRLWHLIGPTVVVALCIYALTLNFDSPLHAAIRDGNYDEVKRILTEDPELIDKRTRNDTRLPFIEAIGTGDTAMVRILLDAGADITNNEENGSCPLVAAAYLGNPEMIDLLIENGATLGVCNNETPLIATIKYGNKRNAFYALLRHGADVNETAVHYDYYGRLGVIREGAPKVESPINIAAEEGNIEFVRELLKRGASIGPTEPSMDGAIHSACKADFRLSEEVTTILGMLLDAGADINAKGNEDKTPLHLIAKGSTQFFSREDGEQLMTFDTTVVLFVLSKGADKAAVDAFGKTPLDYAKECGHEDIAAILERGSLL